MFIFLSIYILHIFYEYNKNIKPGATCAILGQGVGRTTAEGACKINLEDAVRGHLRSAVASGQLKEHLRPPHFAAPKPLGSQRISETQSLTSSGTRSDSQVLPAFETEGSQPNAR